MNKRSFCIINNCELVLRNGQEPTFWCFTLPDVIHPKEASSRWSALLRDLRRYLGFSGVRVFEMHPGGHGLHVHCLCPERYPIREVLRLCRRHGWGRTSVQRVIQPNSPRIGRYLSKYLAKSLPCSKDYGLKGLRWWATCGKMSDKVRIADCTVSSPLVQLFRLLTLPMVRAMCPSLPQSDKAFRSLKFRLAKRLFCLGPDYVHDIAEASPVDFSSVLSFFANAETAAAGGAANAAPLCGGLPC